MIENEMPKQVSITIPEKDLYVMQMFIAESVMFILYRLKIKAKVSGRNSGRTIKLEIYSRSGKEKGKNFHANFRIEERFTTIFPMRALQAITTECCCCCCCCVLTTGFVQQLPRWQLAAYVRCLHNREFLGEISLREIKSMTILEAL